MGFYGNITNTNKTQFSFDKIYPNRMSMDALAEGDGVYIGRFVLVDYEDGLDALYLPVYRKDNNLDIFYLDSNTKIIMTLANCTVNSIYRFDTAQGLELYRVTGQEGTTADGTKYAKFEKTTNDYTKNYECDRATYGVGRGFDGTVWQKTYANGVIKYVMIAELNSVVPSFKVTADAPTMSPLQPHFDKKSNNVAYWLHWQPQWGLRIKNANVDDIGSDGAEFPSDEKVKWNLPILDEENQIIRPNEALVDGAIYYNKKGFDPNIRTVYSGTLTDSIKVEPTGKSGAEYNDHNGTGITTSTSVQPDIQEISIMLPSIGNAISKVWDLTYGADDARNLDVNWNSTKGVRLVKTRTEGTGYDYDPVHVSTIAGAINSVHDLMGQLIITDADIPGDSLDLADEAIYYKDGKFYRKYCEHTYETISDIKNIPDKDKYGLIGPMIDYKYDPKNNIVYYVKRNKEDYFVSKTETFYENRNYYTIEGTKQTLSFEYKPGTLYYADGNSYIKEKAEKPDPGRNYKEITPNEIGTRFYEPKVYYAKTEGKNEYVLSTGAFDSTKEYYIITGGEEKTTLVQNPETGIWEEKTIMIGGNPSRVWAIRDIQFDETTGYNKNNYYSLDKATETYTLFHKNNLKSGEYNTVYELEVKPATKKYTPDTYYYLEDGNYIKDTSEGDKEKEYYLISINKVDRFYSPDKYYYITDEDTFEKDTNQITTPNRNYYEKKKMYVKEDLNNIFPVGMVWDEENTNLPEGLTIGFRTETNTIDELKGFARTFNTIHGLILEIRRLLDDAHDHTRNQQTVQGAINTLNDIIAKFNKITPNKLVVTDEYGRYSPAEYKDNTWLSWDVNHNFENPDVELIHNNPSTAVSNIVQENTTPQFGAKITTAKIGIDAKGHVSNLTREEVTLPKPSLKNNGTGVLTGASLVAETGELTNTYTHLTDVNLDGYSKTADDGDLLATDSLEKGLSKIENNIANSNTKLDNTKTELTNLINTNEADIENKVSNLTTVVNNNEADIEKKVSDLTTTVNNNEIDIEYKVAQININIDNITNELRNADDAIRTDFAAEDNKITKAMNDADADLSNQIANEVSELNKTISGSANTLRTEISDVQKTLAEADDANAKAITQETKDRIAADDKLSSEMVKIVREEEEPQDKNNTIWISPESHEIRIFDGVEWRILLTNPMA